MEVRLDGLMMVVLLGMMMVVVLGMLMVDLEVLPSSVKVLRVVVLAAGC